MEKTFTEIEAELKLNSHCKKVVVSMNQKTLRAMLTLFMVAGKPFNQNNVDDGWYSVDTEFPPTTFITDSSLSDGDYCLFILKQELP